MRPRDQEEAGRVDAALTEFHQNVRALPGIQDRTRRAVFLDQFFESVHRVRYIGRGILQKKEIHPARLDPNSDLFDPLKGAALCIRQGDHDEACWLVFLFTHFGKNLKTGHRLTRDIYGSLGKGPVWTWARISADAIAFRAWLTANEHAFATDGIKRSFGNHRKYETLKTSSDRGTATVFESYVKWVAPYVTHGQLFDSAQAASQGNPRIAFDNLFRSMNVVVSFGRTAKVDYLTMIAKLQLAEIEPGSTYMAGATGPYAGAKLLFGNMGVSTMRRELDRWLADLETRLGMEMGMSVLEDALCNWQKSPNKFIPFRG